MLGLGVERREQPREARQRDVHVVADDREPLLARRRAPHRALQPRPLHETHVAAQQYLLVVSVAPLVQKAKKEPHRVPVTATASASTTCTARWSGA